MKAIAHLAYKVNKILWRITRPVTVGVRAIMLNGNKVLLVKHTYQDHWYIPGGMMKKGETFEQTIKRELDEELGANLGELTLFGVYNNFYEHKNDSIIIFLCSNFTLTGKGDKEIESYKFFDINHLPNEIAPGTRRRIQEYIDGKKGSFGTW